jgi:hypothetical protein
VQLDHPGFLSRVPFPAGTKKIVDLKRKNVFSLVNRLPKGFRQSLPA